MAVTISATTVIPLSSGVFAQAVLMNGSIGLTPVDGTSFFNSPGTVTWLEIDLGQFVQSALKVVLTPTLNGGTITIETSTSPDRIVFSAYASLLSDGTVQSPVNRFMRIRLTLHGKSANRTILLNDFTDDEQVQFNHSSAFYNGSISATNVRQTTLTAEQNWTESGALYRYAISPHQFQTALGVNITPTLSNPSLALVSNQFIIPTSGWKRYDDRDPAIEYIGTWVNFTAGSQYYYKGTLKYSLTYNDSCRFSFIGTKFRFLEYASSNRSRQIEVTVDGEIVDVYDGYVSGGRATVVFTHEGLAYGLHTVVVTKKDASGSGYFCVDAIEIDESGRLIGPEACVYVIEKDGSYHTIAGGAYDALLSQTANTITQTSPYVVTLPSVLRIKELRFVRMDYTNDQTLSEIRIWSNGVNIASQATITNDGGNFVRPAIQLTDTITSVYAWDDTNKENESVIFTFNDYYEISGYEVYSTNNYPMLGISVYGTVFASPTLQTIGSTASVALNQQLFATHTLTDVTLLNSFLSDFTTPFTVFTYSLGSAPLVATLSVVPFEVLMLQTTTIDFVGELEQLSLTYALSGNGNARIIASGDGGETWHTWQTEWTPIVTSVSEVLQHGMTPMIFNERTKVDWQTLGTALRFGYAFSASNATDIARIEQLNATVSNVIASPTISSLNVSYLQIDPLYFGLLFYDLAGSIYSKSDGTIVKWLDLGSVVANTTSLETAIVLRNGYNFPVENILITVNDQTSDGELEFSKSSAPFLASDHLFYESALQPDAELTFYVRLKAGLYDTSGGFFYLKAKASVVR